MFIKKIEIRNFKSIGGKIFRYSFEEQGLTLIKGISGSGKTLLLSAIYFALFGKSSDFKGLTKTTMSVDFLINDINKKEALVTAYLDNGYKVIRGLKPNIFEIYDEKGNNLADKSAKKIDQEFLENDILQGLTSDVFLNTIYLSNKVATTPFLHMSKTARKDYIEQILDLRILYHLNENLKPYISSNKLDIIGYEKELELIQQSIDNEEFNLSKLKKTIEEQKEKLKNFKENKTSRLEAVDLEIELLDKELSGLPFKEDMLNGDINTYREKFKDFSQENYNLLTSKLNTFKENLNTLKNKIIQKKGEKENFDKSKSNYHFCGQCETLSRIIGTYDENSYNDFMEKGKEAYKKLSDNISTLEANIKELEVNRDFNIKNQIELDELVSELKELRYKITSIKSSIASKEELKKQIQNEELPIIQEYSEEYLNKLKSDYSSTQKKLDEEINKTSELEVLKKMINDKEIKSKAIEHFLPTFENKLNELLERFLIEMEFSLKCKLENDFELTFYKNNKETSVFNLSSGQQMLTSLAVTFAFLHLLEVKHKNSFNMLFIDEVIDLALGNQSVHVIDYIKELSLGKSVTVISHNTALPFELFDNIYRVEKVNGFSVYQEE